MTRRVGDHLDGLQTSELRNLLAHIISGDPGSPVKAQFWYNDATDTYRVRGEGFTLVLGRLNQILAPDGAVSLNSQQITNLAAGTASGHAVTYDQLQDAIAGLAWKDSVRVATTAAGTLASSFEDGDTVDGVTLATGDRILIKDQATASQNGIYTVNASGAPTRTDDANSAADIRGATVFVEEGTLNGGTLWTLATDPPITLGTTSLSFVQFGAASSYSAGDGLTLSGSTFNVGAGTGIDVNADDVALEVPVTVAHGGTGATDADGARTNLVALTRYVATIGDNTNATLSVTHSLNTLDLVGVTVWDISSGEEEGVGVDKTSVNAIDVSFSYIPTTNSKRIVVAALKG